MRKILYSLLFLLGCGFLCNAYAGKIVITNDEWTLSDYGFLQTEDTGTFAENVGSWFTEGDTGNFLAYSSNMALNGNFLESTMTSAGHDWTVSTSLTFDMATISTYDAIFLAGTATDTSILIDYVNAGGNVYLAGGTGWGGAVEEAARWNPFLNAFDMGFDSPYNGIEGNVAINSDHAIFDGVNYLYQDLGSDTLELVADNPNTDVLVSQDGHGLYAVYDDSQNAEPVPEPATIFLLGAGLFGIVGIKRRKK